MVKSLLLSLLTELSTMVRKYGGALLCHEKVFNHF